LGKTACLGETVAWPESIGAWHGMARGQGRSPAIFPLTAKSVLRHLNRFTNYVVKGLLGSLLICLVFPVACVLVSCCSLLLAAAGPVLVPGLSLLFHLTSLLLFDLETRSPLAALLPSLLWNILVLGLLQPLLCTAVALVFCPLMAGIIAAAAFTRKGVRHAWDAAMFNLVIRKRARVPAGDSFIVRRVAGPGLAISRTNPVEVDVFTHQTTAVPGLFAMGPLIGDNFVRFIQGGALAMTNFAQQQRKMKGKKDEKLSF